MKLIKSSPTARTLLLAGIALILAAVWAGSKVEQLAQAYAAKITIASGASATGVDFTPTGSILGMAPLNPCVLEPKR